MADHIALRPYVIHEGKPYPLQSAQYASTAAEAVEIVAAPGAGFKTAVYAIGGIVATGGVFSIKSATTIIIPAMDSDSAANPYNLTYTGAPWAETAENEALNGVQTSAVIIGLMVQYATLPV